MWTHLKKKTQRPNTIQILWIVKKTKRRPIIAPAIAVRLLKKTNTFTVIAMNFVQEQLIIFKVLYWSFSANFTFIKSTYSIHVQREQPRPPLLGTWVQVVNPWGVPWPAPSLVVCGFVTLLHKQTQTCCLVIHVVAIGTFDMRVDYRYHLKKVRKIQQWGSVSSHRQFQFVQYKRLHHKFRSKVLTQTSKASSTNGLKIKK